MTDINPRYENGEPYCNGWECPEYGCCAFADPERDVAPHCPANAPCPPALRRQRDEALKERDQARRWWCSLTAVNNNSGDAGRRATAEKHWGAAEAERLFTKEGGTK